MLPNTHVLAALLELGPGQVIAGRISVPDADVLSYNNTEQSFIPSVVITILHNVPLPV
jgi:hypothetical protein